MPEFARRRRSLFIALGLLLAITAGAISYWSATGAGTGEAQALESAQQALVVNQTSTLTPMYPGDSAQSLSGNFDNPNSGPVHVGTVTVSISGVTKAAGAPAGTCDAGDFTLAGAEMTVGAEIPAGTAKGSWSGATIQFANDPAVNQDACKGATVSLSYSAA